MPPLAFGNASSVDDLDVAISTAEDGGLYCAILRRPARATYAVDNVHRMVEGDCGSAAHEQVAGRVAPKDCPGRCPDGMRRLHISLLIADADGFSARHAGALHQPAKPLRLPEQARSTVEQGNGSGGFGPEHAADVRLRVRTDDGAFHPVATQRIEKPFHAVKQADARGVGRGAPANIRCDEREPPPGDIQIADDLAIAAAPECLDLGCGDRPEAVTAREVVENSEELARAVSERSVEVKDDQLVLHALPAPFQNSRTAGGIRIRFRRTDRHLSLAENMPSNATGHLGRRGRRGRRRPRQSAHLDQSRGSPGGRASPA